MTENHLSRLRRIQERLAKNVLAREDLASFFAVVDDEIGRLDASPVERARAVLERRAT